MLQQNIQQKINEINDIDREGPSDSYKQLTHCHYCQGKIIKRGLRKKKYEQVQRYYCENCKKSLVSAITKNKTYPLKIIIESLTLYNKLNPIESIPEIIKEKYGISISQRIISDWLKEYGKYIPFLRMRDFVSKNYSKKEIIEEAKLFHRQIYNFRYNRAKIDMILEEDFKHSRFKPLKEFLELAVAECPHHIFQSSENRASEYKDKFNLDEVRIVPRENVAVKITNFIIQAVSNNKARHETLQEFMIANDTVTVAAEVAILLDSNDINHYKFELRFNIPITLKDGEYITGHIDLLQVRNGSIYILDYKPNAKKEKPVEQLTIYALALARLTGLRLYHFKCAWFDESNYFEFFPLHVVYKLKRAKRMPKEQTMLQYN